LYVVGCGLTEQVAGKFLMSLGGGKGRGEGELESGGEDFVDGGFVADFLVDCAED